MKTAFIKHFSFHKRTSLLGLGQRANDVRISGVGDGERAHAEVTTASGSQLNVVAAVVVDAGFGQHGVVFNLRLPVNSIAKQTKLTNFVKSILKVNKPYIEFVQKESLDI